MAKKISTSSTAEYFAKNLQQVGFSSPTKAVLTTLKEAFDNALDACEEEGILPDIKVFVKKIGKGSTRNTDKILVRVVDNGPGLDQKQIPMVFGEYLASSKFGRGRCSRGQQGIGISAATTWASQTSATGARVITKQNGQRKATACMVVTDLKKNKGLVKDKESVDWNTPHGTSVEFIFDGRVQLNGEGGILAYLRGNILLNPHLSLYTEILDLKPQTFERVANQVPVIPEPTLPHPHTMKLGEFISHSRLFGDIKTKDWLVKSFSRVNGPTADAVLKKAGGSLATKVVSKLNPAEHKQIFEAIQESEFPAPSTQSVLSIGEEALSLSIQRLGKIDYFAVVSRKPAICDFKPVQVEVAVARLTDKGASHDDTVQVLRFANRVPLQFDKSACAIVKAITTVNWKTYGLKQSRNQLPTGPYIIAVSVISPFIKFKNASKETVDASDELVNEIRLALIMAGQRLSRHLKREHKANELETKLAHIERFSPIFVETLCRILKATPERKERAEAGLKKLLARDNNTTKKELADAEQRLSAHLEKQKSNLTAFYAEDEALLAEEANEEEATNGTLFDK